MKTYENSMKQFMDIASKLYEADVDSDLEDRAGEPQPEDPSIEDELAGMGRYQDERDYELAPAGTHDASPETDEYKLLFAIEDYQDRGLSAAHKMFDVNKLREMPIEVIQKIHQLVTGLEDAEGEEVESELAAVESVAMEDGAGASMTPSAPPYRPGIKDGRGLGREQMIQAIDEYQQLGVSSHPVKYDVAKLQSASLGTLADVYDKVTAKNDIDKIGFAPPADMGEAVSEAVLRALKKMSVMNEEQRSAYTKTIKSKMLSESVCFVPMEVINKPVDTSDDDDITRMRRLAGLIK